MTDDGTLECTTILWIIPLIIGALYFGAFAFKGRSNDSTMANIKAPAGATKLAAFVFAVIGQTMACSWYFATSDLNDVSLGLLIAGVGNLICVS